MEKWEFQQKDSLYNIDDTDSHQDEDLYIDDLDSINDTFDDVVTVSGACQPQNQAFRRYLNKINIDSISGFHNNTKVVSQLIEGMKKLDESKLRVRDKSDRATVEQVLDPRTRMMLYKLLSHDIIHSVNGCISTGKEANVYHGILSTGEGAAIKIYKTSILVFKNREQYVNGEFRFRGRYNKHNPRKMIALWAEKELRNLNRLYSAGILSPKPITLKGHVLVMEFLGDQESGLQAPRLKDAVLTHNKCLELYRQIVIDMRKIYHIAKLIHADMSEYNILFHNDSPYYIDVSQSVERDHPRALHFLRSDCRNITEFFRNATWNAEGVYYFRKRGVETLSMRKLFEFITDVNIKQEDIEVKLDEFAALPSHEDEDDEVFQHVYIPNSLHEVIHCEDDIHKTQMGEFSEVYHASITGVTCDRESNLGGVLEESDISNDVSSNEESTQESDDEVIKGTPWLFVRRKRESQNEKRERKAAVRQLQREHRENKRPKHVKKRMEKLNFTYKNSKK